MDADTLAERIEDLVAEIRDSIGELGKQDALIFEGADGRFVTAMLTPYEAYKVVEAIYGQDVAVYNLNYM